MCDTGEIMANQMDDQIQAGLNERDECYARIDELEKAIDKIKELFNHMNEIGDFDKENEDIKIKIKSIILQTQKNKK